MEPGSTSDVPIHGEKTNILFHPTPTVSYEPYFAAMEKKTGALCGGILAAVVILGKMFGASLWGLLPLGACIASGVWLWMKEVIRSGREVEWESEKTRGRTVSFIYTRFMRNLLIYATLGNCQSSPRVCGVDEHFIRCRMGTC